LTRRGEHPSKPLKPERLAINGDYVFGEIQAETSQTRSRKEGGIIIYSGSDLL
jgi:hypothetical protein